MPCSQNCQRESTEKETLLFAHDLDCIVTYISFNLPLMLNVTEVSHAES